MSSGHACCAEHLMASLMQRVLHEPCFTLEASPRPPAACAPAPQLLRHPLMQQRMAGLAEALDSVLDTASCLGLGGALTYRSGQSAPRHRLAAAAAGPCWGAQRCWAVLAFLHSLAGFLPLAVLSWLGPPADAASADARFGACPPQLKGALGALWGGADRTLRLSMLSGFGLWGRASALCMWAAHSWLLVQWLAVRRAMRTCDRGP